MLLTVLMRAVQQPATGSPSSSVHLLTSASMSRRDSKGFPIGGTPGHSGPVAGDPQSAATGLSSEDGTGRLNVPASLEEVRLAAPIPAALPAPDPHHGSQIASNPAVHAIS